MNSLDACRAVTSEMYTPVLFINFELYYYQIGIFFIGIDVCVQMQVFIKKKCTRYVLFCKEFRVANTQPTD